MTGFLYFKVLVYGVADFEDYIILVLLVPKHLHTHLLPPQYLHMYNRPLRFLIFEKKRMK